MLAEQIRPRLNPPVESPVAVTKDSIGLGLVNNTSDASKPLSSAQQQAYDALMTLIGGKAASIHSHAINDIVGLSSALSGLSTSKASQAALDALVSQVATLSGSIPPNRFLADNYTLATLPVAADNLRKYAWVTDLFDGQPDYVISDGAKWKPVRPLASRVVSNANANMTLTALANSPTQIMKGTLTAARTISLSTTYAYSGARFRIKREATGLFNLVVNLAVGLNINLAGAGWMDVEYDGTAWVQTASGGLL